MQHEQQVRVGLGAGNGQSLPARPSLWCNGSKAERKVLTEEAVAKKVLLKLNPKKLPGCHYHRSNPNDVARVEQFHLYLHGRSGGSRPDQQLDGAREMYQKLRGYAAGGMRGRTLYVVPYLMGPPGSALSKVGNRIDGFHLRGAEHGHYDADGGCCIRATGRQR